MTAPSVFTFDPTAVSANIEVLPKGEYEFVVGEPQSFIRKNKKGADSWGIRFPLVLAEDANGKKKGTRIFYNTYQSSEGAQAIAKQFLMAANGYGRKEEDEQRFNEEFGGKDWGYNPPAKTVGDAWMSVKGKRVKGSLDVGVDDTSGAQQQQFPAGCFAPIA
jgi:hypothetical protein